MHARFQAIVALSLFMIGCSDVPPLSSDAGPTAPSLSSVGMGPPQTGSGDGMITHLEITSSRAAGPNVIQERYIEAAISGALSGTFVQRTRGVIHGNGLVTFQGVLEFSGTVVGCGEGTLVAALSGTGQAGLPVADASFRIVDQSSGSLHIAGTGEMHQVGPAFTYEATYVCR